MFRTLASVGWKVVVGSLSLVAIVVSASPGDAQTAGGAGPPPAGSPEASKPAKPGPSHQPNRNTLRNARPSERSGMRLVPREPNQASIQASVEERLQQGQMEEAVAQGQVSNRLEEFYKDTGENRQ